MFKSAVAITLTDETAAVPRPSSTASGDLLLVSIFIFGADVTANMGGVGWTLRETVYRGTGSNPGTHAILSRIDNGSNPPPIEWDASTRFVRIATAVYTDVDQVAPIVDSTLQLYTTAGTIATAPSANASAIEQLGVFVGVDSTGYSWIAAPQWNKRLDAWHMFADRILPDSGATGDVDQEMTNPQEWSAGLVIVKPA
jgi:hypothetical protein